MPNGLALDCPNGVLTNLQRGRRTKKLRQSIVEELVSAVAQESKKLFLVQGSLQITLVRQE